MNNNTIHRRRLRKPIRETLTIIFFGSIATAIAVMVWIGSVVQTMGRIG